MPFRLAVSPLSFVRHPIPRVQCSLTFHSSATACGDSVNHYETLGVSFNASPADIKKQFYALSKTHHPDRNRNDPEASHRFTRISEAYHVLSSPQERERYDHIIQRPSVLRTPSRGSYSSSSGPAGGRPASGLSRRRTRMQGPPPSFYRSGGWGRQNEKRQSQASGFGSANQSGFVYGREDDLPHFDKEGHFRTHENQEKRREERQKVTLEDTIPESTGSSMLANFIFVSGIIGLASFVPWFILSESRSRKKRENGS